MGYKLTLKFILLHLPARNNNRLITIASPKVTSPLQAIGYAKYFGTAELERTTIRAKRSAY